MSGGVGPVSDISLPKEEEEEEHHKQSNDSLKNPTKQPPHGSRRSGGGGGFFSFRQLNALAVMTVFAASGMVALEDIAFVPFSLAYIYFMSRVAFPSHSSSPDPPVFGQNNRILNLYVLFAAIIGLFLPIIYVFEGIFEGDKEGIKAAAPHVFLLASQVFMEGVTFSGRFSLPIRVLVPVFYNAMRVLTIEEWLRSEIGKVDEDFGGSLRRLHVGRALAVANMVFWCFNLFGFLLPVYLPKAFKIYYSSSGSNANKVKDY